MTNVRHYFIVEQKRVAVISYGFIMEESRSIVSCIVGSLIVFRRSSQLLQENDTWNQRIEPSCY
jgi:hypothetical protein